MRFLNLKFTILVEDIIKPLQFVNGVVEKRQTLPILGNVLITAISKEQLTFTGTDLEVELTAHAQAATVMEAGSITVPARKLFDICRSLLENSLVTFELEGNKLIITSGSGRFSLTTLPAAEFPKTKDADKGVELTLNVVLLKKLLDRTQFAMAQQDVRYYLNGTLWQVENDELTAVATDGHRLTLCKIPVLKSTNTDLTKVIIPRKAVFEIARSLTESYQTIYVVITPTNIKFETADFTFISKLIDGRYPDFHNVIPRKNPYSFTVDRDLLKAVLSRVAILSNEKYRGIRLNFNQDVLTISANNPEHEEAHETLEIALTPPSNLELALNVSYLLEMINTLPKGNIIFSISSSEKSVLAELENDELNAVNVIMPLRL
jgi:DNA polymerase-3 subunit beta